MTETKPDFQLPNVNSNLQHLKLPPIISTSVDQFSTRQGRITLPSITQLSAEIETITPPAVTVTSDFFDIKLPSQDDCNENNSAYHSFSHLSFIFDVYSANTVANVDCSKPTVATPKKTRNAVASARSREKRRKRENDAKDLNERLKVEALELKQRNQALYQELSGLNTNYKYLGAELRILTESKSMDEELLAELGQSFKWSRLPSSDTHTLSRHPDPVVLARRQLKQAQMKHQYLIEEYHRLGSFRQRLEPCLMDQPVVKIKI